MNYPNRYVEYLIQFHATRDFFECHELLEEHWKEHPNDGLSQLWVACIQIAVGQYHERRGNTRGGLLMYQSAKSKLNRENFSQSGLDIDALLPMLELRIEACQSEASYEDMNLPINDGQLLTFCYNESLSRGLTWNCSSSDVGEEIIDRHTRRDRRAVIAARNEALEAKRNKKSNR